MPELQKLVPRTGALRCSKIVTLTVPFKEARNRASALDKPISPAPITAIFKGSVFEATAMDVFDLLTVSPRVLPRALSRDFCFRKIVQYSYSKLTIAPLTCAYGREQINKS